MKDHCDLNGRYEDMGKLIYGKKKKTTCSIVFWTLNLHMSDLLRRGSFSVDLQIECWKTWRCWQLAAVRLFQSSQLYETQRRTMDLYKLVNVKGLRYGDPISAKAKNEFLPSWKRILSIWQGTFIITVDDYAYTSEV